MSAHGPIVCILQARMGSTRLPGKILMELAGAPMLQRLIERVRDATLIDKLVIATTDKSEDDAVEALCRGMDVACFRGSEQDVLSRFIAVGHDTGANIIVRLTGDNPFVDGMLVDTVVQDFLNAEPKVDYANNVEHSGYPYGLYVEVVRFQALLKADTSTDPEDREHVTRFIRTGPEFCCMTVTSELTYKYDSLTVDTPDEYKQIKRLFEAHYAKRPDFSHTTLAG